MKLNRFLDLQRHVFPVFLAVASLGLAGASCGKKSSAEPDNGENKAVVAALDEATQEKEASEPKKPIEGVDLSDLGSKEKEIFERLADSLVSPCGAAESLRKSATITKDCKRSIYAARYIAMMLDDGATEDQVRDFYGRRYVENDPVEIQLSEDVPHTGSTSAPVVIVEFMDYGCPACKEVKKIVDLVTQRHSADVVVYYKQYPLLRAHPDSGMAAQAALAAGKQGKYKEMHDLLFANNKAHKKPQLMGYARQIGLDMAKFEADFAAVAEQVDKDMAEGEKLEITGTPSFFVNGRRYQDLYDPRYFANWIEEELAVNR